MLALRDPVSPWPAEAPALEDERWPESAPSTAPRLAETDGEPLAALAGEALAPRFRSWRGASGRRYIVSVYDARRLPRLLRRRVDRRRGRPRRPPPPAGARRHRRLSRARPRAREEVALGDRRTGGIPSPSSRRVVGRTPRRARRSLRRLPLRGAQLSGEPLQFAVEDAQFPQMVARGEHVFGVVAGLPDALPHQRQQTIARHRARRIARARGRRRRRAP